MINRLTTGYYISAKKCEKPCQYRLSPSLHHIHLTLHSHGHELVIVTGEHRLVKQQLTMETSRLRGAAILEQHTHAFKIFIAFRRAILEHPLARGEVLDPMFQLFDVFEQGR